MKPIKTIFVTLIAISGLGGAALAAGEVKPPKDVEFSFEGPFGMYDRDAIQRGFQVYREICSVCHGVNYLVFRNLTNVGYTEDQAKAIAQEYQIEDGPDDFGEMYQRPGRLSDEVPPPYPNEQAARAANGGALPPDLSLITKARSDGPAYLYSLLTGYEDPPVDEDVSPGLYYNPYFPNHQIAMPQPLYDGMIQYMDGTEATVEQMAHDITVFLTWVGEPSMEERKQMGLWFVLYMVVLAILLYLTNRKIWKPIKQGATPLGDSRSADEGSKDSA